jgi:hypothetical protein
MFIIFFQQPYGIFACILIIPLYVTLGHACLPQAGSISCWFLFLFGTKLRLSAWVVTILIQDACILFTVAGLKESGTREL